MRLSMSNINQKEYRPIKVLLIGPYPPPRAGASVFAERLAKALLAVGNEVTLAVTSGGESVELPDFAVPARAPSELMRVLRESSYDVIHDLRFHNLFRRRNPIFLMQFLREISKSSTPLIASCGWGKLGDYLNGASWWRKWLFRWSMSHISHFWGKNPDQVEAMNKLGIEPDKTSRLISALPLGDLPELDGQVAQFASGCDPMVVTSGGFCKPLYRMDMVIRAAGRIRDRFPNIGVLLGTSTPYDPEGIGQINEAIEDAGLKGKVLLIDSYDRFTSVFVAAGASVRASVVEGSSNAVFESLLTGCPTLVSDLPSRPEGVIKFRVDDLDDLTAKLAETLADSGPNTPDSDALKMANDNVELICEMYRKAIDSKSK